MRSGRQCRFGYLDGSGLPRWLEAFQRGLNDLGYVNGRTVAIEVRDAAGQAELLPKLAAELVRIRPDDCRLWITRSYRRAEYYNDDTHRIHLRHRPDRPRPGHKSRPSRWQHHWTVEPRRGPCWEGLQLLAEMVPGASRFSAIWTPSFAANHFDLQEMQAAAVALHLQLYSLAVTQEFEDVDGAFKEAAARSKGVAVLSGPLIFARRDAVVAAAARYKMPAIYYDGEYAESGGLASYGPNIVDLHRSAAVFVDKILKGAKLADLPVQQPTDLSW